MPSAGHASWLQTVDPIEPESDAAFDVVVDAAGDSYAAGEVLDAAAFGKLVVIKLSGSDGSESWRYEIGVASAHCEARALALDGGTGLYVAGRILGAGPSTFVMAKIDTATGAEVWREDIAGSTPQAHDIALDSLGDVIAVGSINNVTMIATKRDGATGAEIWTTTYALSSNTEAFTVSLDASDDVFVGGRGNESSPTPDFGVLKLDATTGGELWRYETSHTIVDSVVDVSGDVLAASETSLFVVRLDGTTGTEEWAHGPFAGIANALLLDGSGDVVVGGEIDTPANSRSDAIVRKLAGATGTEIWSQTIVTDGPAFDDVADIVLDGSGHVLAAGRTRDKAKSGNQSDFLVFKVDDATGDLVWRQTIEGTGGADEHALALDVDAAGNPIAAGALANEGTVRDFSVVKLDAASGALGPLAGRSISFRDPGLEVQRRMNFIVKDRAVKVPIPDSAQDPRTAGATVRIFNPTTLEEAVFALPAGAGWKGLGNPKGSKGYKYRDNTGGACSAVTVVNGKTLKVVCRGVHGALPFSLDEAQQGSLTVSVDFGGTTPVCAVFGGTISKDEPTKFKAKSAPRPSSCP